MDTKLPDPEESFFSGKDTLVVEDPAISGLVEDWHNAATGSDLKKELERKFQQFILKANTISREDLYSFTHKVKTPVQVWFFPTSQAFLYYGASILIDINYGREIGQIENNFHSVPSLRSTGHLYGEYVSVRQLKKLNQAQIDLLSQEGFHTRDIYRISSL